MGKITSSYGWKKLIDLYFPTVMLFEKGRELLDNPDWRARNAQLDRIHKLKGDFVQRVDVKINSNADLSDKSNEELQEIIDGNAELIEGHAESAEDSSETGDGQEGDGQAQTDPVH